MQMAIVVISGYVVASSPPAGKLINWLAKIPKTERSAIAYIAFFTIVASLFNWAFSLVFGGLYVRALARRHDLRMDYRAAGAAAYLGLGATWALGLSSSAAQLQANIESIPKTLLPITGVIPFRDTIFLPQSLFMVTVLTIVSILIAYYSAPTKERSTTAAELGIDVSDEAQNVIAVPQQPSEWLEYSPVLTIFVVLIGGWWLVLEFSNKDALIAISNLNTYNFLFLMLGMLLSWRPKRFLKSVSKAVPSVAGILIQFPIYGSIAYILTKATTFNASGERA